MLLTTACVVIFILSSLQGKCIVIPVIANSNFLHAGSVATAVQGIKLEASQPDIISIDKSEKNRVVKFTLSSSRPNQVAENFDLDIKVPDGFILKVFPSSVNLGKFPVHVTVVIKSIQPWVKCNEPYSIILIASNKFTKLSDAVAVHVTGVSQ